MPFMVVAFCYLGPHCFDRTESLAFVLFFAGLLLVSALCLGVWVRFIPAKVSWVLGALFWLAELGWALTVVF